ncbi:hypothetical protein [Streptomyces sp. x-45]|uniref:hypothetical protein n=1 Tax=Streptomyces sp. x-45 TaxID=2789281 RepID=UPI00398192BA
MTRLRVPHPRRAAFVLTVLLAAGATGCGIGTTGPVQAGAPASGVQRPGDGASTVRLYFAGPYGTRPVTRSTGGPLAPQQALDLLLEGPTPAERERGLTTHVEPEVAGRLTATTGDGTVDVVAAAVRRARSTSGSTRTGPAPPVPGPCAAVRAATPHRSPAERRRLPSATKCGVHPSS